MAAGSVDAYVDFSNIGKGEIIASADRKTVTINLPAPQLEPANLDLAKTTSTTSSRALINKIGDIFGGDPNKKQELYLFAQQKMPRPPSTANSPSEPQTNTKAMLTGNCCSSLGYTTVTVVDRNGP